MSENNWRESLFYEQKNGYDLIDAEETKLVYAYCEGYKRFMDAARTEREAVKTGIELAEAEGFVPFVPGMVTSNEPGVYLTGKFGVRIENLVLTVKSSTEGFLGFETLTVAPYDRDSIIPERLTDAELKTLNDYHEAVFEKLSPYLTDSEVEWLRRETEPITR